jgi:NAD(P)-dependent dehydrogenase (short-subunit alcohol dehydrogenase family)
MKLQDKVAIITGGSSGIGRAITLGFVKAGAKVVIAALHEDKCKEVVQEVKDMGGEAIYETLDVGDVSAHPGLIHKSIDAFGKVDILVNDAAYSRRETVFEVTPENWDRQIDISLKGLFFLSQHFAKHIINQNSTGRIINIGSVAGVMDFHPISIAYHAAKAGVMIITKVMAVDLAPKGITVNCIAPGSIETPMSSSADPKYDVYMTKGIPEGRRGTPDDIVPPAVMFASDEAQYITGQTIFVEGGALSVYLGRDEPEFKE